METARKHIFITGSVGVGKSTAIQETIRLSKILNLSICYIKEYIDYDVYGVTQYDNWSNGRMALIDFQKYICNQFRAQLKSPEYMLSSLVIWERHPREALMVFSQTGLSESERDELNDMITELEDDYEIPKIETIDKQICYRFNMTMSSPQMIANHCISLCGILSSNDINCFFVYLYYPVKSTFRQLDNIRKRGRKSEIERYNYIQNLIDVNRLYEDFVLRYFRLASLK